MSLFALGGGGVPRSIPGMALAYLVFDGLNHGAFDLRWGHTLSLTAMSVALLVACVAVDAMSRPERLRRLQSGWLLALALFLLAVIVSALTIGAGLDISFVKNGVLVASLLYFVDDERWIKGLLGVIAVSAGAQLLFGVVQAASVGTPSAGLTGQLPNHVQYGLYLGVAALAGVPFVASARQRESLIAGSLLYVPLAAVVLASKARGSILALFAAVIVAVLVGSASRAFKLRAGALVTGTFAIALAASDRLRSVLRLPFVLGDIGQVDAILNQRAQFLGAAWNMFRENPLLGLGYGQYRLQWYEYAPPAVLNPWNVGVPFAAHSTYLQILAELGLAGLVPYAVAIVGGAVSAARASRFARTPFGHWAGVAILASLLAFAFHGVLDNSGWHDRAFYIYLGLAFAAPRALAGRTASELGRTREGSMIGPEAIDD